MRERIEFKKRRGDQEAHHVRARSDNGEILCDRTSTPDAILAELRRMYRPYTRCRRLMRDLPRCRGAPASSLR
jgi:hypothetical protein